VGNLQQASARPSRSPMERQCDGGRGFFSKCQGRVRPRFHLPGYFPSGSSMKFRWLAGPIVMVGGFLLVSSIFVGWYEFRYDGNSLGPGGQGSATFGGSSTFFPGSEYRASSSCSGSPSLCAASGNANQTGNHLYANPGLGYDPYPNTGLLFQALQYLLLSASILAFAGGALAMRAGIWKKRGGTRALVVVAIAAVLSFAAPLSVWTETPATTHADYAAISKGLPTNFSGPGGSFWGSCASPSCGSGGGITDSWGPVFGWYECWAASVIVSIGLGLLLRSRRLTAGFSLDRPSKERGVTDSVSRGVEDRH
jgi:hypothetical protein